MKRMIKHSVTSSTNTNPQSEYEYRKNIYLKRKHEFETLGEDGNNDVLSREEKMNIAKAEMNKVDPKSVNSADETEKNFNYTGDPDPAGLSEGALRWADKYKTWQDVYSLFIEVANNSNNAEDIESEVYKIYQKGKGLPQFDKAYSVWMNSASTEEGPWKEVESKQVLDSDGFLTDYTLYTDGETYICMFGDKDIYEPDAEYADYETDDEKNAWDWFNTYEGFADDFEADEDE